MYDIVVVADQSQCKAWTVTTIFIDEVVLPMHGALAQFVPHAMQSAISHMPCEPQYKHNPLTIGNVM